MASSRQRAPANDAKLDDLLARTTAVEREARSSGNADTFTGMLAPIHASLLGSVASASALPEFVPLTRAITFTEGEMVLCQRSSGEWCHANVFRFEDRPGGGLVTLRVDFERRKKLDLSDRRHLGRVRVAKARMATPSAPLSAAAVGAVVASPSPPKAVVMKRTPSAASDAPAETRPRKTSSASKLFGEQPHRESFVANPKAAKGGYAPVSVQQVEAVDDDEEDGEDDDDEDDEEEGGGGGGGKFAGAGRKGALKGAGAKAQDGEHGHHSKEHDSLLKKKAMIDAAAHAHYRPAPSPPAPGPGGDLGEVLWPIFIVVLYYLVGMWYYHYHGDEHWDFSTCFYFTSISITTVGYGDVTAKTDRDKQFTMVYVVVGFMAVYSTIAGATDHFLKSVMKASDGTCTDKTCSSATQRRKAKALALHRACKSGNHTHALEAPMPLTDDDIDATLRGKRYFFVAILLLLQICGGVALCFIENWSYMDGLYWAFQTTSTVGYGDIPIQTYWGRQFAACYALFSVGALGACFAGLSAIKVEAHKEKHYRKLMRADLDGDMIKKLDRDGDGVDRAEFLMGMLVAMEFCEQRECDALLMRFDELDADGSGRLDHDDLEAIAQAYAAAKGPKARRG